MATAARQGRRDRARRGSRPSEAQKRSNNGSNGRPKVAGASALPSALHVLDGHLHPLTARSHSFEHPSRRYENLCLIERVICLERDLLDTATESEAEPATLSALSTAIELSLKRYAWDLEKSGRWLSERARKRAEEAAASRFDAIVAELARELGQAPDRPGRERAVPHSPRAAADAPRPAPWPAFVAIASRRAAIASRRLSMASRRVSRASRAQLERVARLPGNHGVTRAQAARAIAVAAGLAALAGITSGLSGGSPGGEGGNAYGSSGSGALRATSPDGHVAALAARGDSTHRGTASSRDRRHSRDAGRGKSHGGKAGSVGGGGSSGGSSGPPGGGSGQTTGTGTPYTGGDGTSYVAAPAPAPSYTSGSQPTSGSTPTSSSSSDGPVTSTVRNVDQTASDAGVNTGASGATSDATGQVDRTVNNLSNDVKGTTDSLLGN
jgi:hypothetical protein